MIICDVITIQKHKFHLLDIQKNKFLSIYLFKKNYLKIVLLNKMIIDVKSNFSQIFPFSYNKNEAKLKINGNGKNLP